MKISHVALIVSLICLGKAATAASFDCNKANGYVELTICTTPALSSLDEQLNALYKKVNQSKPESAQLIKKAQLSWLKDVRNKATTAQGITNAYTSRINDLNMMLSEEHTVQAQQSNPVQTSVQQTSPEQTQSQPSTPQNVQQAVVSQPTQQEQSQNKIPKIQWDIMDGACFTRSDDGSTVIRVTADSIGVMQIKQCATGGTGPANQDTLSLNDLHLFATYSCSAQTGGKAMLFSQQGIPSAVLEIGQAPRTVVRAFDQEVTVTRANFVQVCSKIIPLLKEL